ncbi:MAG: two-component system heavy metal sensor histidine kinase CusS [Verrucomicrobiales bacterium]|jgi:two-component system heavy metal sensor histidine kinase CusS
MRRLWPKRIPFGLKIGLSAALLSAAAIVTFIIASAAIVFDNMMEGADFELREIGAELAKIYDTNPPTRAELERFKDSAPLDAELATVRVRFYANSISSWKTDDPNWDFPWLEDTPSRAKKRTVWFGFEPWRVYSKQFEDKQRIVLSMDLHEVKREVWRMVWTYISALPFAVAIVGFGSWIVATRSAKPLQTLAAAMEHVAQGNLRERIDVSGRRDALDRLAVVFNRMTGKLESSFEQASRFTSDASHELRTPLTVLRGHLENALQRAEGDEAVELARLLEQSERLRAIVDGLLLLSRSDAGRLAIGKDEVDLSELVDEVAQDFCDSIEAAGIEFKKQIKPGIRIRGDQQLLRQVVGNLLGNAEKFNLSEGGSIGLSLWENLEGAVIEVESTGRLIPEEDHERVFRRFYRKSSDKETPDVPGTGLGLSIVQATLEAHGGKVRCETTESGSNRFVVEIPGTPA